MGLQIKGAEDHKKVFLQPGTTHNARVYGHDYEYDALAYAWDIRREVKTPRIPTRAAANNPSIPSMV